MSQMQTGSADLASKEGGIVRVRPHVGWCRQADVIFYIVYLLYISIAHAHSSLASNLIQLVHTPCSCPCPKPTSLLNAQQPTEQCLHRLTLVDPRLPPDTAIETERY